jgi:hypothetical protein
MKRHLIIFLVIISISLPLFIYAFAFADTLLLETGQVYVERVLLGVYYHTDPMCPNSAEWFLPMNFTDKPLLNLEQYSYLRPCFLCMPQENEVYYKDISNGFSELEISDMRYQDKMNSELINSEHFTLEDWAAIDSGNAVPSESDISREEAIHIAKEKLTVEYSIDEEGVQNFITLVRCHPNIEHNERDDLKCYALTFIDMINFRFYYVDILTPTGDIVRTDTSDFSLLMEISRAITRLISFYFLAFKD